MEWSELFSSDPQVMSGAVVFRGTCVPAEALFANLASGMSLDEFRDNFPTVERAQAEGAITLAEADLLRRAA